MKQVIIYNQINLEYHGGARYKNEELFNFLKANIDQSLRLGWKPEEIILGTNFVKGFAATLGIGVVISLFTSLNCSKTILKFLTGYQSLRQKNLYLNNTNSI